MLKRKILAAVLPVVAAGTVVGSGFSAWYFGNFGNESSSTVSVGIDVADSSDSIGELTTSLLKGNLETKYDQSTNYPELMLDQGTGEDRITNEQLGISFVDNNNTKIDGIIFEYKILEKDLANLCTAGLSLKLSASITINTTLSEYVELRTDESGFLDENAYYKDSSSELRLEKDFTGEKEVSDYKAQTGDGSSTYFTFKFGFNLGEYGESDSAVETDGWNGLLKYKVNDTDDQNESIFTGKPKTHKQVGLMTSALESDDNGGLISFNFKVSTVQNSSASN